MILYLMYGNPQQLGGLNMKPIKSLIVSLCLAIALILSGTFVTNVRAEGTDPQNPRPAEPQPSPPPDIIRIILTVIGALL